jgi:hypothetical protein
MINICKGIKIIDLALYLEEHNTLIIADTHIGYEEALNKQGFLIPRFQFKELLRRIEKIFTKGKKQFKKIVINGDIKHEFGIISKQEWRHTLQLLDFLGKHCEEVILIKGNHDSILGPIAKKRNVKVKDYYIINGNNSYLKNKILITHGNEINNKLIKNKQIKIIIIGHEHPALSLKEGLKIELYKCYLKGRYKDKILIAQPSFNLVREGTDILNEQLLSPFLQQDLDDFNIYLVQDKVYDFGRVRDLKN